MPQKPQVMTSQELFRSTYRLQLQKSFPLEEAAKISGYLDELGVSHLYLSPVLEAREGSNHGYDAIDPTKLSEERGGEEGFKKLLAKVEASKNIEGVILDIVPNHVAASPKNPAWWDVLKNGEQSKFWRSFDIRARNGKDFRVVLPVLGRSRQSALAARELKVGPHQHQLVIRYYDNVFPISGKSYSRILRAASQDWSESVATAFKWKKQILSLSNLKNPEAGFNKWIKANLSAARALEVSLKILPLKFVEMTLDEQNYSLEEWKSGSREVNYRRFFDINELAAVRVEDKPTFKWSHSKIRELSVKYPLIHGLRVDHVDGLTNPQEYLKRLSRISKNVWVEKILGEGEKIPSTWSVRGTTGYEFSNATARVFVSLPGLLHLHSHYTRHVDRRWERFHECVYDSKREMLESHFVSELNYLTDQLYQLASRGRKTTFTRDDMHEALKELTSSLRVYRTYFGEGKNNDKRFLESAFAEVEGRGRLHSKPAMNWLRSILLGEGDWSEATFKTIKRWEQLTGPVMAKGLEDTALYRYFPLLSLNGVGGEPDWTGDGAIEFHAFNQERLRTQPYSMSTTSTHDTKRSEDVRSRMHVISELAEEWTAKFEEWHKLNLAPHRAGAAIDISTEYMIYETLLGAWPLDGKVDEIFADRMKQYFLKAVREGKSETSWTEPNEPYETALKNFIDSLIFAKTPKARQFMKSFKEFQEVCSYFGAFNSLSLLAMKALSPGLPDFYQGCEMWDLSLVDPDNRRPVDYAFRRKTLREIKAAKKEAPKKYLNSILSRWKTGEVKLWLTWELLKLRKQDPLMFTEGEYFAIEPHGEGRSHFVAFFRNLGDRWMLAVIPRFLASSEKITRKLTIENETVLATTFDLLQQTPSKWKNAFTGDEISGNRFTARELLAGLPVGVWLSK